MEKSNDDGLASLVAALPREFTSRFGEVCWAYGGFGFGWWPSCIFDPRLTEGSARQTARKNLGKKHLIYFFECHEAPFAVLGGSKLCNWTEGVAENYYLGKTARAAGRHRGRQFQQAFQAAIVEEDKPLEMRLDWNRSSDDQPQLLPIPRKIRKRKRPAAADVVHLSPGFKSPRKNDGSNSEESLLERHKQKKKERKDVSLFCKVVNQRGGAAIGFVKVSSKTTCTFRNIRNAIKRDLVPEALSRNMLWAFYISSLGLVTTKQELNLGPVLPFLRSGIGGNATNGGSIEDPITVFIQEV